jgi:DNA-binding MarR family transcriptional regulator
MVRSRSDGVNPLPVAEVRAEGVDAEGVDAEEVDAEEVRAEGVDSLFLVWLAARSTEALLDRALAPVGLSGDEFALYSMLAARRSITPTELARWMAAPPTTVSSYVKRLESRGHASREPNPDDRRSYRLRLTRAGRAAHVRAVALVRPLSTQVAHELADDDGSVGDALLRVRAAVDVVRSTTESD